MSICSPIPGALQKVSSLRARHDRLKSSLEHHEAVLAQLSGSLDRGSRAEGRNEDDFSDEAGVPNTASQIRPADEDVIISEEDLLREEEEIRAMERKKRELEERVSSMDRDLGGLLR